jgi:hypothetical protein
MKFFKYGIAGLCFFVSCNFNPDKHITPSWTMDFLGPIVKADMNIQNINEFMDLYASQTLSLEDCGAVYPNGTTADIPALGPTSLGPYDLNLTVAFTKAALASGKLSYKITNGLEINVNAGTTIQIKQGSTILLSNNTPDIAALGGIYTSPATTLSNIIIDADISLTIPNFSSNGSGGAVTINSGRRLLLEIFLNDVKVKSIDLGINDNFSLVDTSDFIIHGTNIPSQSVSGTLTTFLKNNFPVNFDLQVYFLDEAKTTVLDSLFNGPTTILAGGANPAEVQLVTIVNNKKITHLNNSSFARTELKLGNHGSGTLTIPDSLFMHMQIVGDLKIKLNK